MYCSQQLHSCQLGAPARAVPPARAAAAAVGPWHQLQPRTLEHPRLQPLKKSRPFQWQHQRGELIQRRAGPIDAAPAWTLDQLAGLAFGVVMLAFYFGSKEVDVFIAKQQRKQLGLCERCGGLYDPATCSQDKCPLKSKPL